MLTHDARRTTHDDVRQPIANSHLSNLSDLKDPTLLEDQERRAKDYIVQLSPAMVTSLHENFFQTGRNQSINTMLYLYFECF